MLCDRTDMSDVDSLSQTGTDNAKVTFCLIPKMLVCVLIFDSVCLCVYGFVQYPIRCVFALLYGILNYKSVQFVCTGYCETVCCINSLLCVHACWCLELSVSFFSFCTGGLSVHQSLRACFYLLHCDSLDFICADRTGPDSYV